MKNETCCQSVHIQIEATSEKHNFIEQKIATTPALLHWFNHISRHIGLVSEYTRVQHEVHSKTCPVLLKTCKHVQHSLTCSARPSNSVSFPQAILH